jgi:serine/threonine protein kinase
MLEAGDKLGEYTLKNYLGEGKYGVVWLAEKPIQFADKGVLRALKFLSGQTNRGADFESVKREVNNWIEASGHPNVASVSDAFIDGGRFVIVSEYASGGSLRDWLEKNDGKAPSIEKAVGMMSGILNGLVHLHSLNITHRDLKPANILLHHEMPR